MRLQIRLSQPGAVGDVTRDIEADHPILLELFDQETIEAICDGASVVLTAEKIKDPNQGDFGNALFSFACAAVHAQQALNKDEHDERHETGRRHTGPCSCTHCIHSRMEAEDHDERLEARRI